MCPVNKHTYDLCFHQSKLLKKPSSLAGMRFCILIFPSPCIASWPVHSCGCFSCSKAVWVTFAKNTSSDISAVKESAKPAPSLFIYITKSSILLYFSALRDSPWGHVRFRRSLRHDWLVLVHPMVRALVPIPQFPTHKIGLTLVPAGSMVRIYCFR